MSMSVFEFIYVANIFFLQAKFITINVIDSINILNSNSIKNYLNLLENDVWVENIEIVFNTCFNSFNTFGGTFTPTTLDLDHFHAKNLIIDNTNINNADELSLITESETFKTIENTILKSKQPSSPNDNTFNYTLTEDNKIKKWFFFIWLVFFYK